MKILGHMALSGYLDEWKMSHPYNVSVLVPFLADGNGASPFFRTVETEI